MKSGKRLIELDLSAMGGGLNTTDPAISIKKDQVQLAINAQLKKDGFEPHPGYLGISSTQRFTTWCRGLHVYEKIDGTEILLCVSGGKLYSVNESTGALTELYNMTGIGEAWFANILDKCFVCNGSEVVKVESASVAYPVSIAAPVGVTAQAKAGGSLAAGVYKIYASYARSTLYSQGLYVGTVTLAGGNGTVEITNFPNSSDAQVDNKVIWMTNADGDVYYFYHDTDNNTTTTFDITSTANRDTTLIYDVEAALNYACPNFSFINEFDNKIYGSVLNVLYWSIRAGNVYDLEKFNTQQTGRIATYPFNIIGFWPIGNDLYLSTPGGMIRIPYGDPLNSYYYAKNRRYYFKYPRTVKPVFNGLIGLTNDGVKIFDGEEWTNIDIAKDVKPYLDNLYTSADSDTMPAGEVYRRGNRTEYHLCFYDNSVGSVQMHNQRLILNIDSLYIENNERYKTAWEVGSYAFSHSAIKDDGAFYQAQSLSGGGCIYKEDTTRSDVIYVFDEDGAWLDAYTNREMKVETGEKIMDPNGRIVLRQCIVIANSRKNFTVEVVIGDTLVKSTESVTPQGNKLTFPLTFPAVFSDDRPRVSVKKLSANIKGRSVFVRVKQTDNDPNFDLTTIKLVGYLEKGRFI